MEESFKIEPFAIKVGLREFSLTRKESTLTIHPANAEQAINVLVDAMRIESFSMLPKQLTRDPYFVSFKDDRSLALHEKYQQVELPFTFEEGDILIGAVKAAMDKWLDLDKHNSSKTNFIPTNNGEGIPFDTGR